MFQQWSGGSTPPSGTMTHAPEEAPGEGEFGWLALLRWSALMLLGSVLIAAVSIPLLRLCGVDWGA